MVVSFSPMHWLIIGVLCLGSIAAMAAVAVVTVWANRSTTRPRGRPNLDPCPDCGQMVSRLAKACPRCGRPLQS